MKVIFLRVEIFLLSVTLGSNNTDDIFRDKKINPFRPPYWLIQDYIPLRGETFIVTPIGSLKNVNKPKGFAYLTLKNIVHEF